MIKARESAQSVSEFSRFLRDLGQEHSAALATIAELDTKQSDYLHKLDRETCLCRERSRIATQLHKIRVERRELKDWIHTMRPVIEFLQSDKGAQLERQIDFILGKCRQAEQTEKRKEDGLCDKAE